MPAFPITSRRRPLTFLLPVTELLEKFADGFRVGQKSDSLSTGHVSRRASRNANLECIERLADPRWHYKCQVRKFN